MSTPDTKRSELLIVASKLQESWKEAADDEARGVHLDGIQGWGVWSLTSPQTTTVEEIREVVDFLEGDAKSAFLRGTRGALNSKNMGPFPDAIKAYINEASASLTPITP